MAIKIKKAWDKQFKQIIKALLNTGFYDQCNGRDGEVIFTNKDIRVGIFPHSFLNKGWAGHVLAEHEENFDKWSKHFYRCSLPSNKDQMKLLLSDLKYINNNANKKSGNEFGRLIRYLL